jgi:hypothetical protein
LRSTTLATALTSLGRPILSHPFVANNLGNVVPTVVGVLFGSPLGYTPPTGIAGKGAGVVSDYARAKGEQLGNAISRLFDDPATPQYPASAPASGGP